MSGKTFLLEVGCEELPDRMVDGARLELGRRLQQALQENRLVDRDAPRTAPWIHATPRRLVVRIEGVVKRQPDETLEITGPPVAAAFDSDGKPTRAAKGFASGQGAKVSDLYRVQGAKGEVVAVRRTHIGREAAGVLGEIVPPAVLGLAFPKTMSWGLAGIEFARPIRWVVALLDDEVVPMEIAGVASGRSTASRRGSQIPSAAVAGASTYVDTLVGLQVQVDVDQRRHDIRNGIAAAAGAGAGSVVKDDGLVEIVSNLVEYPGICAGGFPEEYLELPDEVLTTTLRHHQRCFSVTGADGKLTNRFIAVVNVPADPDGAVRGGYERVIAGRLADARFFYSEDRKRRLEDSLEMLERTRFHAALGSYADKAGRLEKLVAALAGLVDAPAEVRKRAARAARLSKCDLATQMENEFPELQGVVGGLYAREEGEPEPVWRAVYDHYRPAGQDDALPRDLEGALLSAADRLDNLVGLMGVGVAPKGSRDPFALRRAALGLVRLLVEYPLRLSLDAALGAAWDTYQAQNVEWVGERADVMDRVTRFIEGRFRFLFENADPPHRYDSVTAIIAAGWNDVAAAAERLKALSGLRGESDFEALAAASKRIRNILSQAGVSPVSLGDVQEAKLQDRAERDLHAATRRVADRTRAARKKGDHTAVLRSIASLRPEVDRFFDEVLVMADDAAVRRNRLALLASIAGLYAGAADFAEIVVEGSE